MSGHSTASLLARHAPHNWEFADSTERENATYADSDGNDIAYKAADVGKWALQLDDGSVWRLTAITPTWARIGAAEFAFVAAPTTASDAGIAGQMAYDADGYFYLCIATNTWVRLAGATWS